MSSFHRIYIPIASTNQPKMGRNNRLSIFLDRNVPINIPPIASPEKRIRNLQSITWCPKSPINPINAFVAITNNEVPIATFIGKRARNTIAGTIRNPPPAPTSPVIAPTPIPCRKILIESFLLYSVCSCSWIAFSGSLKRKQQSLALQKSSVQKYF